MIDGGPRGVYNPHLKPRIRKIREAREIATDKPLQVEMIMISHVDDDHIQGILDLTSDLITANLEHRAPLVQAFGFWHNSFEDVIGQIPQQLEASLASSPVTASVGGAPPSLELDLDLDDKDEDEETIVSTMKVLASVKQGQQLRSDVLNKLEVPLNAEFDGQLIMAQENGEALDMGNGLTLKVVGPMLLELKRLQEDHQKWLKGLEAEGKTAEDVLAAYVDKSVPNLSSVVVLAELDGKQILLTGDARGDNVLRGLELVGLVEEGGNLKIDILKVPHHGSSNNLDNDFFERIHADHYVFSGNGEHGNPERESLEMLVNARGDSDYTIHLTYPVDEIDIARKAEWDKQQDREKKRKAKAVKEHKKFKEPREDWSDEEHSLAALFAANPSLEKKLSIIEGDEERHVIDLLDESEF